MALKLGIDVGSTTVKLVVIDEFGEIKYKNYERHKSKVREKTHEMLEAAADILSGKELLVSMTGSAGFGIAKATGINFVQEVFATAKAVEKYLVDIDVAVELGGEDAKIIFFTGGLEERMNGSCAGGTGAFIDQMATLLGMSVEELDELSFRHKKVYPIASRCGVFAKSDIQPLLNQGAQKEDIAVSIFQAVVDQTVTGLAQGRKIEGKVAFLGGPLTFMKGLRARFKESLGLSDENAVFPENSQFLIAMGAAEFCDKSRIYSLGELIESIKNAAAASDTVVTLPRLFENEAEYEEFSRRHSSHNIPYEDITSYSGNAYLGVDAGSTTTKLVLISEDNKILYKYYMSNLGNPVSVMETELKNMYKLCGDRITVKGSAVTGYGEELIKNAFSFDAGLVETVAHFTAASYFKPDVDFIIDIGGQDIKCFRVKNGVIDSIMLNEACSSGCGSFIETFAKALGYSVSEFSKLGLFAEKPVDLGSRCTVFMNSSVKQAQKEGASVGDISAGLSSSVVKNAIYKVIRETNPGNLGQNIVVQGGTFLNDAVLRCFEREIGQEVVRPAISEIMGAFGAALYAKSLGLSSSSSITAAELDDFSYTSSSVNCSHCSNKCLLTVNKFGNGIQYISGNRCERPTGKVNKSEDIPNLMKFKRELLEAYRGKKTDISPSKGRIGIPYGLNFYETLPFWAAFFTALGYDIVLTPVSSRELYAKGQHTIPSDTVCYPAKLMHGHIDFLLREKPDYIFYPCMPYNLKSGGDNSYNCPVVAYYPELLAANVKELEKIRYLSPYLDISEPRAFKKSAYEYFSEELKLSRKDIFRAADAGFAELSKHFEKIRSEGIRAMEYAEKNGLKTIVIAGRPYHIDPEINHGIDQFITSNRCVIITEDCASMFEPLPQVKVLNQWSYHSRMYAAAAFTAKRTNTELIQLVSFGCGIDAITTDEMRSLLESRGKLYTQIKIDEINNLGTVKIRIRSLLAAMQLREGEIKNVKNA